MTTSTKRNFTKNALMAGSAVVTLTGVAANQQAHAVTVTGTGNINAVIVNVPNITEQTAMHFGSIGADAANADTVTLSPAGARTTAGGFATLVTGGAATPAQGVLRVNNPPTATTITYSVTAAATVSDGGGNTMTVNNFQLTGSAANAATNTRSVTAAVTQFDINIGADLGVGIGQTLGTYTGTYTLNLSY